MTKKKKYILIEPPLYEVLVDYDILGYEKKTLKEQYLSQEFSSHFSHSAGLLRIGAYLKDKGNEVHLINCLDPTTAAENISIVKRLKCGNYGSEHIEHKQIRIGMPEKEIINRLRKIGEENEPDEIYVTSYMTYHYRGVYEIVDIIKRVFPKTKVIVGGIYASLCPEHALNSGADEVHEGRFCEAEDYSADYSLLDYKPDFVIVKMTRGCPNNCDYCAVHILEGHKMYFRDIKLVCNEIKEKVFDYGVKNIYFWESNILINSENYFEKILDFIIEEIIPHQKEVSLHFPEAMDPRLIYPRLITKLKDAGTKELILSLETIDEEMLQRLHRKTNFDDLKRVVEECVKQGIDPKHIDVYIMIGLADQSLDSILMSCVRIWELGCKPVLLPFTPIPKTKEFIRNEKLIAGKDLEELHLYLFPFASEKLPVRVLRQLLFFKNRDDPLRLIASTKFDKEIEDKLIPMLLSSDKIMKRYYEMKFDEKGKIPDFFVKRWNMLRKFKGKCLEIGILDNNKDWLSERSGVNADIIDFMDKNIELNKESYNTIFDVSFLSNRPDIDLDGYFSNISSLLENDGVFMFKIYSNEAAELVEHFMPGTFRKRDVLHTFIPEQELRLYVEKYFSDCEIKIHTKKFDDKNIPFIYEVVAKK